MAIVPSRISEVPTALSAMLPARMVFTAILALVMVASAIWVAVTALAASLLVVMAALLTWVVVTELLASMAVVMARPSTLSATLERKAKAPETICWRGEISLSTAVVPSSMVTPR